MVVTEFFVKFPWVVSVAAFTSLLVAVIACVCRGRKKESVDFGMPAVSYNSQNCTVLVSQPLDKEKRSSSIYGSSEHLSPDLRTRPSSVNRALPDIPVSTVPNQSSFSDTDTDLELYAAVNKPSEIKNKPKNHRPNKPRAPQPPRSQPSDFSSAPSTSTKPPFHVTSNGSLHPGELQLSAQNHYDQPSGSSEANPKLSKPDSEIIAVHGKAPNKMFISASSLASSDTDTYEPPPVPEKRFDLEEESGPSAEQDWRPGPSSMGADLPQPSERSAVPHVDGSRGAAAAIHITQPVDARDELENREGSEVPYTVISVREPLAKVREQTFQQMKRRLPHQQSSSSQEGESHYMEVADEEQTYAEIESTHNSGRGSSMYDRIEPAERDVPPAPPTVESLMTVAQVHSRQASNASAATSLSSRSSSPRAVSPTAAGAQSKADVTGLYSVVNKPSKQRQTIHVAEGASLLPLHNEPPPPAVEDLYAKVRKNRSLGSTAGNTYSDSTPRVYRDMDDVFYPPGCSIDTPPEPPPITGRIRATSLYDPAARSTNKQVDRRLSANPDIQQQQEEGKEKWAEESEPGYERVNQDHSYEKVTCDSDDPGYEIIQRRQLPDVVVDSDYEQIRGASCSKEYEPSDPGYERVQELSRVENDLGDPGYESVSGVVREDSDMDPDYEQISRVCQLVESDNDAADPGYECVNINGQDDNTDPGYDHVVERPDVDSDFADSDYETVCRVMRSDSEGYERIKGIQRTESDATEPGYEKVRAPLLSAEHQPYFDSRDDDESLDPGYEPVGPSSPLISSRLQNYENSNIDLGVPEAFQTPSTSVSMNCNNNEHEFHNDSRFGIAGETTKDRSGANATSNEVNGHEEKSVIQNADFNAVASTAKTVPGTTMSRREHQVPPNESSVQGAAAAAPPPPLTFFLQHDFVRDIEDTSL